MNQEDMPLISVLTPCYNSAHLIPRLLNSILSQTYPNIEMIVVNDGSEDNIEEVIESYKVKFYGRGYCLTCVSQENGGQSVAINTGLKLIKGEYLIWPDADDWFGSPDAIMVLYNAFQTNGANIGMTRCLANKIDEHTLKVCGSHKDEVNYPEEQFENCIYNKNFYWLAGGCLVRTKDLFNNVRNGEIYTEKKAGQNWQLMMPMLYKQRCITIKEKLYCILVRSNSHSRPVNETFDKRVEQLDSYLRTIIGTLDRMTKMTEFERERYKKEVEKRYIIEKYVLSYHKGTQTDQDYYEDIIRARGIHIGQRTRLYAKHNKIYHFLVSLRSIVQCHRG